MASPEVAAIGEKRSRSRSPARDEPKPKKKFTGLKYKDKKAGDGSGEVNKSTDTGLHRGYRDRSPRKDSYRARSPPPARQPEASAETRDGDRAARQADTEDASALDGKFKNYRPPKRAVPDSTPAPPASTTSAHRKPSATKVRKPRAVIPTESMIVVNVNDRLGTKAAIPCLASDSVKAFKAVVAAHIGRQPHEIMIKRQGERPFKDVLTLEDYGVSSGVQLDLEIETGD